jgi:hypothetical protein
LRARFTKERLAAGLQSGIDEAIAKAFAHHLKCTDAIVNQGIKIQTIIFRRIGLNLKINYIDFCSVSQARKRLDNLRKASVEFRELNSNLLEIQIFYAICDA